MAIYRRSGTDMDQNSAFFPPSFLNGFRGGRVARLGRLGRLGEMGDEFGANFDARYNVPAPFDPAPYYGTDPAAAWPMEPAWNGTYATTPAGIPPSSDAQAGWSWSGIMDKATSAGRDLLLSNNAKEAADKLNQLNAARQAANLPPLPPGSVPVNTAAPRSAVTTAGGGSMGLVVAFMLAGGLLASRAKRSRRRR